MSREMIAACLLGGFISFMFAACGGETDECVECPAWAGAAVVCNLPFGETDICGIDQKAAATSCFAMGGVSWVPATVCALDDGEGETGENHGGDPLWSPTRLVTFDSETNEYVIDQFAFEELKLDPAPLFGDTSQVELLDAGYYQVAVIGELADTLGWREGDIFHSVNGHSLEDGAAFAAAFVELADETAFQVTIEREQRNVILRYRVK